MFWSRRFKADDGREAPAQQQKCHAELEKQVAHLTREFTESVQEQTATSEILRVISNSPTDIGPVLDAVSENAARLCAATNAVIFQKEGDVLRQVASYGGLPTTSHPAQGLSVNRDTVTGRSVFDRQMVHVHDLSAADKDFPLGSQHARRDGHRTTLATPLLREGVALGAILIRRMEVRPFSEGQIRLLKTFADQAAIAIEHTRLFEDLQEKSRQLQLANTYKSRFLATASHDLRQPCELLSAAPLQPLDLRFDRRPRNTGKCRTIMRQAPERALR